MINIVKGLLTALATLVPGVSGGTMMIILDVYDDSIHALSSLISGKLRNTRLIIELIIGALIGFVFFSKGLEVVISTYPKLTSFLFLGIIIAGIGAFINKIEWKAIKTHHLLYLAGGFIVSFVMTYFNSQELLTAELSGLSRIIFTLISGVIIAVALILPGISTSFLLLSLGMYDDVLRAFSSLDLEFILYLGVGVIFGVLLTTKLLEHLLNNHPTPTYLMILGFVVGSVGTVWPGLPVGGEWIPSVLAFVAGIVGMILLQRLAKKHPEGE